MTANPMSSSLFPGFYRVEDSVLKRDAWLTPQGALFDITSQTAFVSDLHLGKSTSFRKAGLGVPEGSDEETLSRLAEVLDQLGPRRLVILGDLVHDAESITMSLRDRLCALRARNATTDWHLVMGNHDRKAVTALQSDWADRLDLQLFADQWQEVSGLIGRHAPTVDTDGSTPLAAQCPRSHLALSRDWSIAGHLHPAVFVRGAGRQRLRLRCFAYRSGQWLLPAFGAFTGGLLLDPSVYHAIFPVAGDQVFCLKPFSHRS